jgi:hypothetical protein
VRPLSASTGARSEPAAAGRAELGCVVDAAYPVGRRSHSYVCNAPIQHVLAVRVPQHPDVCVRMEARVEATDGNRSQQALTSSIGEVVNLQEVREAAQ